MKRDELLTLMRDGIIPMGKTFKRLRMFLFLMLFALIHISAIAQPKTVSGKVTDTSGEPIPGVNIILKGTTQGTITDVDGNYLLSNVPDSAILVFSFVGMKKQEIEVGMQSSINVTLVEETTGLDEIVIVGYGTARKGDLTGSIATVSTKDFDKVPATNPLQALQGMAAGLQITTNSGMPGSGGNVLIRGVQSINGSNSPIYVVDGVITSGINNLNLNNIESASILKDASAAAIYGARAANGVILITTKRGTIKKDVEITLNAYYGFQTESNLKLKLLNADQFVELWTESHENAGIDLPWTDDDLALFSGVDTDWKDLMMQTGTIQNYDISVSGGSEKSNYFISAGLMDQKGMLIETGFKKYTLTFNSDHKINDWIKFGNSLNIYNYKREGETQVSTPYTIALRKSPLSRAYENDGDYGYLRNSDLEHFHANPVWQAKNNLERDIGTGLVGNLYVTFQLLKGLEFTAKGGMDYSTVYSTDFLSSVPQQYGWEGSSINSIEKGFGQRLHWISDFLLNYNTTIADDHKIKALLGYSAEESSYENLMGSRTGTPNDQIQFLDAGDPNSQINNNGFSDWAFISTFGRVDYAFKNKYLLTATVRRDGTSRLIEENRFGVFPSASIAWRISEEGFLQGVDFIDDLKVRASYGTLGNILSIGPYGTTSSLSSRRAIINQEGAQAYTLTSAINANVQWEEAKKKNIGLDATLFDHKLYTNIDYFIEDTYDLLFSENVPWSTGLSGNPQINAGEVRNSGYEVVIGYRDQKANWWYDASFNISHVKNEVIDLGGRDLRTSGIVEGYPVRSYFGYESDGIIYNESQLDIYQEGGFTGKEVGDIHLLDIDGYDEEGNLTGAADGEVNAADRTLIGSRYPDFIYGALGTIGYKNWSFHVQLQGVQGIDLYYGPNNWNDLIILMASWARNEDARLLDRYHPTKNPNGTWPRVDLSQSGNNTITSEFWLKDASYLRVKNVYLNYNVPKQYCKKVGMSQLGLYVSVQNAYTFTKFDGPEIDTTVDPLNGVPQPCTWTFGLKATF